MEFLLNKEKTALLMIGKTAWTYDEPGPTEIDLNSISQLELNQIVYNCRRGYLFCGDPEALMALIETVRPPRSAQVPVPVVPAPVIPRKPIKTKNIFKDDIHDLKKLLKSTVSSIKKDVCDLPVSKVRKLLALEKSGKKRKSLISLFNEIITKHQSSVQGVVGDKDVGKHIYPIGVSGIGSPNVSDIVESEEEIIICKPTEG